jgi:arginine/lysine/ornithine decarboxylase
MYEGAEEKSPAPHYGLLSALDINANEIEKETGIKDYGPTIEAAKRRKVALFTRQSFAFETVMYVPDKVDFLAEAKWAGGPGAVRIRDNQEPRDHRPSCRASNPI